MTGPNPTACTSCGHLPPIGQCMLCRIEICEHCRHDNLAHLCDGCGCGAESAARVVAPRRGGTEPPLCLGLLAILAVMALTAAGWGAILGGNRDLALNCFLAASVFFILLLFLAGSSDPRG